MEKTFNPEKYNMTFCPLCKGIGKLPKSPYGLDICKKCGGFGLIKKESEIFEEVEDREYQNPPNRLLIDQKPEPMPNKTR